MSTPINDGIVNVICAGKPKDIPIVVDVYNRSMGGVRQK